MQHNADRSADEGFTLVEVLVSIAIISVVMTSVAMFLINSTKTSRQQSVRDTAAQVAVQGMENARGVRGSALLSGRVACDGTHPCAPLVSDTVAGLLGAAPERWDAPGAGAPALPTPGTQSDGSVVSGPGDPEVVVLSGLTFRRYYYVAKCWQAAAIDGAAATSRPCTVALASAAFPAAFVRLVVAVTWRGAECVAGTCSFAATSLLSASATDPFLAMSLPLAPLTNPGDQTGRTGVAVPSLTVAGATGQAPLVWSSSTLPAGLTINSLTGAISGTPVTVAAYVVDVKLTDALGKTAVARFNWTILPPILTSPGDQLSRTGTVLSLSVAVTGGVGPIVWSATGLPAGVTMNSSTGVMSGTPTTARALTPVTVTIVDRSVPPRTVSVSFGWRVLTPVTLYDPGPQSMTNGTVVAGFTPYASGGTGAPYVWQGFNLPDGLTINTSTGAINGTVTSGSRFITTVTATDSLGGVGSMTVVCTVTANPAATDLRVAIPAPIIGPTTALNAAVTLTPTAAGGSTPYTWTVAGLPPGVTLRTAGVMSGNPTASGSYPVRLTVTSAAGGEKAIVMFVWTVT